MASQTNETTLVRSLAQRDSGCSRYFPAKITQPESPPSILAAW